MTCSGNKTVRLSAIAFLGLTLTTASPVTSFAQPIGTTEGSRDTGAAQIEREKAEAAHEAREAERAHAARVNRPEYHYERPGELYVAGFGGYTFGHSFNNAQGTGALSGVTAPGIDLKNSGIYGAKIGYFFPDRLNWLGVEVEGFNTSPNFKQSALGPGASLRVTTVAFNLIARGKYGCRSYEHAATRRTTTETRSTTTETRSDQYGHQEETFCPL